MELSTVNVKSVFPSSVRLIVIGFWVANCVFHCSSEVKAKLDGLLIWMLKSV